MIRYDLICLDGHKFDAWFKNAESFDEQQEAGILECAVCGKTDVQKALMTPNVPAKSNQKTHILPIVPEPSPAVSSPVSHTQEVSHLGNANQEIQQKVSEFVRHIRKQIDTNTDDVGERFAEEALKIHHEEVEARGIRGQATQEELTELAKEGVEFMPVPVLPEEMN